MATKEAFNFEDYQTERSKMGRPIPGQSLTNDPDAPAPYEQAPKFTNIHEINEYLWDFVTDEEVYPSLMMGLSEGVPVMNMVQTILFKEFSEGTMNPDLMLMTAEPLAYMLIALAERLDIDIEIDSEGEEDEVFGAKMEEDRLETLRKSAKNANFIPQGFVTSEMESEMQALPQLDSLLSPPTEPVPEETEAPQQPSLMAPPEGQ